ncbi:anti-sigma factor [Sphingomonas sp.]|uniref:anti-sigma factor n=1 Tax=Sphingomonas sp. TaxID=28214 RepID=UPI002CCDF6E3|nr:anti-sigma factor [Sphingomonas sp.]HTG38304.1 anti-sigma factor [Sphingomonas sp.]
MASNPPIPEDMDLLAAELVLGLLPVGERTQAEARRAADPAFDAAVLAWERRLAPLYDEIADVAPDPSLWPRIEARLPVAPAANDDRPGTVLPWKVATGLFGTVAAALALVLITRPDPQPLPAPEPQVVQAPAPAPAETLVAQLNDGEGASMLAIRLDTDGQLRVRATDIPDGTGEPELWVIPAGGAPVSLGLIAREGESRVALDGSRGGLLVDGATLALTLEPREGAPHAAPSGDILGTARITRL